MENDNTSPKDRAPDLPAWAEGIPNFWEDPALVDQAHGDPEYLDLLAWREVARLRAQSHGKDADQEVLGYYLHMANAVKGYEQAHGIIPPGEA